MISINDDRESGSTIPTLKSWEYNKNFSVKITSNLARSLNSEEEANFSISFKLYLAIGIPSWWTFFKTFINSLVLILLFVSSQQLKEVW